MLYSDYSKVLIIFKIIYLFNIGAKCEIVNLSEEIQITTDSNYDNPNFHPKLEEAEPDYSSCGSVSPEEIELNEANNFPWTVAIANDGIFLGSGSLISPNTVLTIASMLIELRSDQLMVCAGKWNIMNENEEYPDQCIDVETIARHENYDGGLFNNVALLKVQFDFIFQPNIRSVCLPSSPEIFDYSTCKTVAWLPSESDIPLLSKFQIQTRSKCNERLPIEYLDSNRTLHESLMCAIDASEQKILKLNSGAALICPMLNNPNRYIQAGIVIGSIDSCNAITGLFVNMTHVMPWIYKKLGTSNVDLKYYLPSNECLCNCQD